MPIISAKCVACHGPKGDPPRLDGGDNPGSNSPFNRAYEVLLARENAKSDEVFRGKYVQPGHARLSPLVWHIHGRNTARPWDGAAQKGSVVRIDPGRTTLLTAQERKTFVEWIDMGALWDGIPGPDSLAGGPNTRQGESE
jgi:hypothetical protein